MSYILRLMIFEALEDPTIIDELLLEYPV